MRKSKISAKNPLPSTSKLSKHHSRKSKIIPKIDDAFFENLFILTCKFPNWLSRDKTSSTLTTEYTFNKYIPDRSIMLSRMKVRQEPPARKGYYGKQGG